MQNRNTIYGIKFPFTAYNEDGHVLDLNKGREGKVVSDILHVILTRKGTRLRMPDFGTDLTRFIFEPNDEAEWSIVKEEVVSAVSKWVGNVKLNDIEIVANKENENEIAVGIDYSIVSGDVIEHKKTIVKI